MSSGHACFRLDIEGFNQILYDLMLSGRWQHAFNTLKDSLDGISYDEIVAVLEGKAMLQEHEQGVTVALTANPEYQNQLKVHRAGWCLVDGKLYRPDFHLEGTDGDETKIPIRMQDTFPSADRSDRIAWFRQWYANHADDPTRAIARVIDDRIIVFEQLDGGLIPLWFKVTTDPEAALADYQAQLPLEVRKPAGLGTISTPRVEAINKPRLIAAEPEPEPEQELNLDGLRDRIWQQNGDAAIELEVAGSVLRIPRTPFLHWVFERESVKPVLPEWESVCMSGLKLQNDSQVHSDWMVGAGIDLDKAYSREHSKVWEERMFEIIEAAERRVKIQVHSNSKGTVTGEVVYTEPDKAVEPGCIAVAPTGEPAYQTALVSTGAEGCLVSEVGGMLSHLAIVSREYGAHYVVLPNALSLLQPGMHVLVDFDRAELRYATIEPN